MEQLASTIKSVFSDFDEKELHEGMTLAEIPDWDSMNSINLMIALESTYKIKLTGTALTGDTTIKILAGILKAKGAAI